MKKAWCPETAEKSLIETVKLCGPEAESNADEMISAMAGGWNSKLIVETWSSKSCAATTTTITSSIGLAVASRHTGGRHVCIVPDDVSRHEYTEFMRNHDIPMPEVVIATTTTTRREFLDSLVSIDFLFIQGEQDEFLRLFGGLKLCHLGAVVVWKGNKFLGFKWQRIFDGVIVGSFALPNGLDIAYIAAKNGGNVRWVRQIDRHTGEEHIFRG